MVYALQKEEDKSNHPRDFTFRQPILVDILNIRYQDMPGLPGPVNSSAAADAAVKIIDMEKG